MSNYSRRSEYKSKNKGDKVNKVLNILIGVVLFLIIVTVSMIFFTGNDDNKSDSAVRDEQGLNDEKKEDKGNSNSENNSEGNSEADNNETSTDDSDDSGTSEDDSTTEGESNTETEDQTELVTTPSDDPIVKETVTNPAWQPIGTEQTGEHVSSYTKETVDWNEKVKALSYSTNLSEDNMIVWHLGNGGSPDKSLGVVSSKDRSEMYRVYLQWVDGQGWKPERMDILNSIESYQKR